MKIILITLLMFVSVTGCSAFKVGLEVKKDNTFTLKNSEQEQQLSGKENYEWGVALSGGGIRSAVFNIGVLKSLYDNEMLDKIEVISAVSGGGYAAYWLLNSHYGKESPVSSRLGEGVFNGVNFLSSSCRIMARANFVTNGSALWQVAKACSLSDLYRCKIERTFGKESDVCRAKWDGIRTCKTGMEQAPEIHQYLDEIKAGNLPYFIYNTTLADVEDHDDNGWKNGLYEITPLFRGNEGFGYKLWGDKSLPLSQVSSISGAAVRSILGQDIKNPHLDVIGTDKIKLSDGGHSENLGAVALIRRGVKNIIVVDAEMDLNLAFEGYYILEDRLRAWGLNLHNSLLDSRKRMSDDKQFWRRELSPLLKGGEFKATVTNRTGRVVSTIHYIKMSIVGGLAVEMADNYAAYIKGMKESIYPLSQNAKIRNHLNKGKVDGDWQCNDKEFLARYPAFDPVVWGKEEATFRKYGTQYADNFPHFPTMDQSYYNDQLMAYIGLGYMQAEQLVKKLLPNKKTE